MNMAFMVEKVVLTAFRTTSSLSPKLSSYSRLASCRRFVHERPYYKSSANPPSAPPSSLPTSRQGSILPSVVRVDPKQKTEKERRKKQTVDAKEFGKVLVISCNEISVERLQALFPTAFHDEKLVTYFSDTEEGSATFVFPYGVCVFWSVPSTSRHATLEMINRNGFPPPKLIKVDFTRIFEDDMFYYSHMARPVSNLQTHRVVRDRAHFQLFDHTTRLKLVLSHAFAQGTRLDVLERQFKEISVVTKPIALEQRSSGKVPSDWAEEAILSTLGALEAIKREVNVDGYLKNTQDLFWDEDDLADILEDTREYLDISKRSVHLTEQIGFVAQQLQNLLGEKAAQHAEKQHQGSVRLEWYIILLIAYEAIIAEFCNIGKFIHASLEWLIG